MIKIIRSFTRKVNLGNYETADFVCSYEAEVAVKDKENASEAIHEFCKNEVVKSINKYKTELLKEREDAKESKKETIDRSKFVDGAEILRKKNKKEDMLMDFGN